MTLFGVFSRLGPIVEKIVIGIAVLPESSEKSSAIARGPGTRAGYKNPPVQH